MTVEGDFKRDLVVGWLWASVAFVASDFGGFWLLWLLPLLASVWLLAFVACGFCVAFVAFGFCVGFGFWLLWLASLLSMTSITIFLLLKSQWVF